MAPPRVALFDDSGAAEAAAYGPGVARLEACLTQAGLAPERLTREQLNDDTFSLAPYDAFVFPGGYTDPGYTHHLTAAAKERLRARIAEGGTYMGVCAGAFFASSRTSWHGGYRDASSGLSLDLLDATAVGPILELADYPYWSLAQLQTDEGPRGVWYAAGPWFEVEETDPNIEVVARYDVPHSLAHEKPAVVAAPYGEGQVVLWGPHPEGAPGSEVSPFVADTYALAGELLARKMAEAAAPAATPSPP